MNDLRTLIEKEALEICKEYRIGYEEALAILEKNFRKSPARMERMGNCPVQDIPRLSVYRQTVKQARKEIYYSLRRYHHDEEKEGALQKEMELAIEGAGESLQKICNMLLQTHISTQERFPYYPTFYEALFKALPPPSTVLDVGCGIHPLSYPFSKGIERYVAIDKDRRAIDTLAIFSRVLQGRLVPICADIGERDWAWKNTGKEKFEMAFFLKLVPVLHRQSRNVLPLLCRVPASRILITASSQAMTREKDISRRENRILMEFIKMTRREIVSPFRIENEFGYLIE